MVFNTCMGFCPLSEFPFCLIQYIKTVLIGVLLYNSYFVLSTDRRKAQTTTNLLFLDDARLARCNNFCIIHPILARLMVH